MNPDNNNRPNQQNQGGQPARPFQNVPPAASSKPDGETMGFDKYVAIALIVGLIAGFIIGQSVGANNNGDEEGNNGTSTESSIFEDDEEATTTSRSGGNQGASVMRASMDNMDNEVEVSNQKAGNNVTISKLVLDKTYWVAVRDSQETTKSPFVLGGRKLSAGTHNNITIYVPRATEAGKKYDIVFYKDSPTATFSRANLIMNGNSVAGATFQAN